MGKYGAGTTFLQRAVADVICGELPTAPSTAALQVELLRPLVHKRAPLLVLAKMRPPILPVTSLRIWAKFNGISFENISVEKNKEYGGYGIISTTTIPLDQGGSTTVLNVPKDLILSAETIAEHAKVDKHFGQVLEAVGGNVCVCLVDHVERITNSNTVVTWGCNALLADASY